MNPFKTLLIPTVIRNLGAALKKLSAAVTAKNDHVEPQIRGNYYTVFIYSQKPVFGFYRFLRNLKTGFRFLVNRPNKMRAYQREQSIIL